MQVRTLFDVIKGILQLNPRLLLVLGEHPLASLFNHFVFLLLCHWGLLWHRDIQTSLYLRPFSYARKPSLRVGMRYWSKRCDGKLRTTTLGNSSMLSTPDHPQERTQGKALISARPYLPLPGPTIYSRSFRRSSKTTRYPDAQSDIKEV